MIGVAPGTSPYSCYLPLARPLSTPPCFAMRQVSTRDSDLRSGCSRCFVSCCATKQQRQARPAKKKTGRRKTPERMPADDGGDSVEVVPEPENVWSRPSPLPKPPAGFVLDEHGRVLLASSKRITTIVHYASSLLLLSAFTISELRCLLVARFVLSFCLFHYLFLDRKFLKL